MVSQWSRVLLLDEPDPSWVYSGKLKTGRYTELIYICLLQRSLKICKFIYMAPCWPFPRRHYNAIVKKLARYQSPTRNPTWLSYKLVVDGDGGGVRWEERAVINAETRDHGQLDVKVHQTEFKVMDGEFLRYLPIIMLIF